MDKITVYPLWDSPVLRFAARELRALGVEVAENCRSKVTHVLLPVPSPTVKEEELPPDAILIGGNLNGFPDTYRKIDLLQDAQYVAENAALTADCALRLLGEQLGVTFRDCPILVIGWGRIGKCLCAALKALDAKVTVAARKEADRGMLSALGYGAVSVEEIVPQDYRAIVNTVPAPMLDCSDFDGVAIDLASSQGLTGAKVLWARGLPGKMLPESSGQLISRCILRILRKKEAEQ